LYVVSNALYLISDIIHTCLKRRAVPTVKQINLISIKINFIKEFREKLFVKKANRVPALEGKVTVEGSVVAIKRQEDMYGITYKMLVNDKRGFDVWSTVPNSILGSVEIGNTVKFNATLTKSDKDEGFAFAKRPTKAEIVN
jgi:hypothetical protein